MEPMMPYTMDTMSMHQPMMPYRFDTFDDDFDDYDEFMDDLYL
jgi:hypothetical protein